MALPRARVRAVDSGGGAGPAIALARTQPPVVEDIVASVLSPTEVELNWTPPAAGDVVGYRVERAAVEVGTEDQLPRLKERTPPLPEPAVGAVRRIGAFAPVHTGLLTEPHVRDTVDLARPHAIEGRPTWEWHRPADQWDARRKAYRRAAFAYRVRAVNALGVEGGPSPSTPSRRRARRARRETFRPAPRTPSACG